MSTQMIRRRHLRRRGQRVLGRGGFRARDFWTFKRMITPVIIQVVFWIGVLVCEVVGFSITATAAHYNRVGLRVFGWLMVIMGPVFIRIMCEALVVFFRINETLMDIKDTLRSRT